MGHSKLPWKKRRGAPNEIWSELGPVAIMAPRISGNADDEEANADLIITAVNVMPEIIVFLKQIMLVKAADWSEVAEEFLKQLEGVDG